jgi:D-glycero-alpha-D-manno-heptose-7-phosphate kinase
VIVTQTPLRISFVGGGTDFEDFYLKHGGAVLTTAIDKYVFVIVNERFDDMICVNYTQRERVEKVEDLRHELVREALKMTGINKSIEITTLSDVPAEGTGLGSSSTVTVGLLQALHSFQNDLKTAETLADEACHIEIENLQKPIGRQDQYIAAYGNFRFISFSGTGIKVENVVLTPDAKRRLNESLICFYTGITRKSSEVLEEQKANINHRLGSLNQLKSLAFQARDLLIQGAFDEFGKILNSSWQLKKTLASKVSNPEIDEMYDTALKAGALGGKITGAGNGGFLLLYCPKAKQDNLRNTLRLRELPIRFEQDGSKIIFNYRRAS